MFPYPVFIPFDVMPIVFSYTGLLQETQEPSLVVLRSPRLRGHDAGSSCGTSSSCTIALLHVWRPGSEPATMPPKNAKGKKRTAEAIEQQKASRAATEALKKQAAAQKQQMLDRVQIRARRFSYPVVRAIDILTIARSSSGRCCW